MHAHTHTYKAVCVCSFLKRLSGPITSVKLRLHALEKRKEESDHPASNTKPSAKKQISKETQGRVYNYSFNLLLKGRLGWIPFFPSSTRSFPGGYMTTKWDQSCCGETTKDVLASGAGWKRGLTRMFKYVDMVGWQFLRSSRKLLAPMWGGKFVDFRVVTHGLRVHNMLFKCVWIYSNTHTTACEQYCAI